MTHRIEVNRDLCKKCHNCIRVCTSIEPVLEPDEEGYPRPVRLDKCVQCLMCMVACPTKAIKHYGYREVTILTW